MRADIAALTGAARAWALRTSPICAALAIGVAFAAHHSHSTTLALLAALAFALVPLALFTDICQGVFLGRGQLLNVALARVVPVTITAAAVISCFLSRALDVNAYLMISMVATVATSVVTALLIGRRPKGGAFGPLLPYARKAWIGSLANIANSHLDQLLIFPFMGARDLGLYVVAVNVSTLPIAAAQALGARVMASARDDVGAINPVAVSEMVRQVIVASSVLVGGLAAVGTFLLSLLFGSSFDAAAPALLCLLPGTFATCIGQVVAPALLAYGLPSVTSRAQVSSFVVTALGLAATLPTLGIVGAAVTTSVAYWVRTGIMLRALTGLEVSPLMPTLVDVRRALSAPALAVAHYRRRSG